MLASANNHLEIIDYFTQNPNCKFHEESDIENIERYISMYYYYKS